MNQITTLRRDRASWRVLTAVLCAGALGLSGCGLKDESIPDFVGPSALGQNLGLTATPDIILANGMAVSAIQARLLGPNGQPLAGREIVFNINDEDGRAADIGNFRDTTSIRPLGTAMIVVTNANGVATTFYEAPNRPDFTGNGTVVIGARPVGSDANAAIYRSVRLELRSAEPRLFPQVPGNVPPTCRAIFYAPTGFVINRPLRFESTASDADGTIVRYEWLFIDDAGRSVIRDAPQVNFVWSTAGTKTVVHTVTDDDGGMASCTLSVPVLAE